ncbi:MAG: LUD domain-containing protein, partial [Candidatus Aureabacteria bacterium]|nr:LUD domain-containing protein [Candidatus Auribacterota bacterium]
MATPHTHPPDPRARTLLDALSAHGMMAVWAAGKKDALDAALARIAPGDLVGAGGSVTLDQIGLITALRAGGTFSF